MQTRQANLEGKGEINLRHLVREALRMRPQRITVGVRHCSRVQPVSAHPRRSGGRMRSPSGSSPMSAPGRVRGVQSDAG
jgi:pilus assembly protein CpaF